MKAAPSSPGEVDGEAVERRRPRCARPASGSSSAIASRMAGPRSRRPRAATCVCSRGRHDEPVEDSQRPADDVEVAERDGVERARVDARIVPRAGSSGDDTGQGGLAEAPLAATRQRSRRARAARPARSAWPRRPPRRPASRAAGVRRAAARAPASSSRLLVRRVDERPPERRHRPRPRRRRRKRGHVARGRPATRRGRVLEVRGDDPPAPAVALHEHRPWRAPAERLDARPRRCPRRGPGTGPARRPELRLEDAEERLLDAVARAVACPRRAPRGGGRRPTR